MNHIFSINKDSNYILLSFIPDQGHTNRLHIMFYRIGSIKPNIHIANPIVHVKTPLEFYSQIYNILINYYAGYRLYFICPEGSKRYRINMRILEKLVKNKYASNVKIAKFKTKSEVSFTMVKETI